MAGSVSKRGKYSYRLTYVVNGLKYRKTIKILGKNEKENRKLAEQMLLEFIVEVDSGSFVNTRDVVFKEFAYDWLELIEHDLAVTTLEKYERVIEQRLVPEFGNSKLNKITNIQVKKFINKMLTTEARLDGKKGKLSATTVKDYYDVLSVMLNNAYEWELMDSKVMDKVKPPRIKKSEAVIYQLDDIKKMLEALSQESLQKQILFLTAMSGTLRRGELVGINFNDVNEIDDTIHINKSVARTKEGVVIKDTKNKRNRTIAIPSELTNMYKQLKKDRKELKLLLGALWEGVDDIDNSPVFIQKNGKRIYPTSPTQMWDKFIKKHKLKKITLHQLRHTGASLLIAEGVDLQTVSSILGHSRASTTAEIYIHLIDKGQKEAANVFKNILFNV